MHVSVLDFVDLVRVSVMGKSTEARTVQVHGQGLVACYQHVDPKIELLASNQKRVHDVFLDDIGLSLWAVRLPSEIVLPLRYLSKFVEKEDASAL